MKKKTVFGLAFSATVSSHGRHLLFLGKARHRSVMAYKTISPEKK